MAANVAVRYRLVPMVVKTPKKPSFGTSKHAVRSVSSAELEWARKELKGRVFKVTGYALQQPAKLAKQVAAQLRALDPDTELADFVANESIPVGPIWKDRPYVVLHPSSGGGSICVSCDENGSSLIWTQLAFRAVELD